MQPVIALFTHLPVSGVSTSWTAKWDCLGFSGHSASLRYCWLLLKLCFQKSLVLWIQSASRILVFGDGVSEVRENFHRLYHSRQQRCACNSLYAFVCDLSHRWYSTSPVTLTSVNIGSGNGLLPDGTKPLPEPMLTDVRDNFHRLYHSRQQRCACNSLCICLWSELSLVFNVSSDFGTVEIFFLLIIIWNVSSCCFLSKFIAHRLWLTTLFWSITDQFFNIQSLSVFLSVLNNTTLSKGYYLQ